MTRVCPLQVYAFGGCLSPYNYSHLLTFKAVDAISGLASRMSSHHLRRINQETQGQQGQSLMPVFCVPLIDLLASIGVDHVDFLSLDVEGAELNILETIDFHRLRIDVLMVEWNNGQNRAMAQMMPMTQGWHQKFIFAFPVHPRKRT